MVLKKDGAQPLGSHSLREGALLVFSAIAIYLLVALFTYHSTDPGWSHSGAGGDIANGGGVVGAWFADVFLYLFGYFAYLFPVMAGYAGWLLYHGSNGNAPADGRLFVLRGAGFVLTMVGGAALAALHFADPASSLPLNSGGILGDSVGKGLVHLFSFVGATLLLLALFLSGVTLFTGLSWIKVTDTTGRYTLIVLASVQQFAMRLWETWQERRRARAARPAPAPVPVEKTRVINRPTPRIEPVIQKIEISERAEKDRQVPMFNPSANSELPSLALLDDAEPSGRQMSDAALEAMSRLVEIKLRDFDVEVEVESVHPGPVITRFELRPAPGVKVSQITNLSKDLARALSVISVRVVEVIPGKSTIGLEIPNEHRETVRLSEILKSREYDEAASPLALALGKEIDGRPVVVDLARMPHLLVAGTTGSGKSVGINAMILSLLYNATPNDVRLIMIDPKMLELSIYEGVPHLLTPVVTDMKQAASALRWCVAEMEKRYKLMASLGVRNIGGYNRKVTDAMEKGKPLPDPLAKTIFEGQEQPTLQPLPYIVVVIDEFADMMMVVGKKVEQLIARLAQKARASGIHLILATQRPSVDVITGLIKANIPTRIAFQVSSKIDSRTIIDQMGAEQLLGNGDMLYLPPGTALPVRVHGAFVADHEVHKVVAELKKTGEPDYLESILHESENGGDASGNGDAFGDSEQDDLYDQALRIVTESRRASISGLQRRLKVGYNRAARMIEAMEAAGVVGPLESNGSRDVLAPPPPEG